MKHRIHIACMLVGPMLGILAWSPYLSAAFYYLGGFCVAYGILLQRSKP